MKFKSRSFKGKASASRTADGAGGRAMEKFPWKNPLKGGYRDIAMAEVSVKGGALRVGFKVKF